VPTYPPPVPTYPSSTSSQPLPSAPVPSQPLHRERTDPLSPFAAEDGSESNVLTSDDEAARHIDALTLKATEIRRLNPDPYP